MTGFNQAKDTARVFLSECRARRHGHGFWFAFYAAQRTLARLCTCTTAGTAGSTGPFRMNIHSIAFPATPGKAGETAQGCKKLWPCVPDFTIPNHVSDFAQLVLSHLERFLLRTAHDVLRDSVAHVWMLVLLAHLSNSEGRLVEHRTSLFRLGGRANNEPGDLAFGHISILSVTEADHISEAEGFCA